MKMEPTNIQLFINKGGVNQHIATINKEPIWFQKKINAKFEKNTDDLGEYIFAPFQFDGNLLGLHQYLGEEGKGVSVFINRDVKNKKSLLENLLRSLELQSEEVSWIHCSAGGILIREFMMSVEKKLKESSPLIQILTGPRQVGKTTGAKFILKNWQGNTQFETADDFNLRSEEWVVEIWNRAKQKENTLLVIDEFQKIPNWSNVIKFLWEGQDKKQGIKLILLGSNSLSMNKNLGESLAGRFELTNVPHWNFEEYKTAFNTDLDHYLLFGGYPKAADFINNFDEWLNYITNSIIKPVVTVDIPFSSDKKSNNVIQFLNVMGKHLGDVIPYSELANELPFNTNSNVVKEYIELFEGVFFCQRLKKLSKKLFKRDSSPSILPLFTSLFSFFMKSDHFRDEIQKEKYLKSAVGQTLLQNQRGILNYWKEGRREIDYVYEYNGKIYALQVGDKLTIEKKKSLDAFKKEFSNGKSLQITSKTFEQFSKNPIYFLESSGI